MELQNKFVQSKVVLARRLFRLEEFLRIARWTVSCPPFVIYNKNHLLRDYAARIVTNLGSEAGNLV